MIYVNSDLATGERDHYLVRGVLYYLGFPGETRQYPTSIFYSQPNDVVNLSTIDWQASELMYGNKISNGINLTNPGHAYDLKSLFSRCCPDIPAGTMRCFSGS